MISNDAILFLWSSYENKPLRLKTLIEHYFTIKGLSWQCTKIDHICLRLTSS